MASGNVTKSSVDNLQPGVRDAFLWDKKIPGFGVKVTPKGSKVYLYQYRMGGRGSKVRRFTIGKHGPITPDAARKEASRLASLVLQGEDPQAQRQDRRKIAVEKAFSRYLDHFAEHCLRVDWKASADEVEAMLRTYALPVLGDKPLPDITAQDISAVLRPLRNRPASRSKLFAVMRRLFRWAKSEGDLITPSPMADMETPAPPPSRKRVLKDWELALVWDAAATLGYPFGPMVRVLILTGQRRNEVSDMPWQELDHAERLWSLPEERAKNGEATNVPLSSLAMAEFTGIAKGKKKAEWPRTGFVFTTTGKAPVSGYSRAKARLDKAVTKANGGQPLEDWTLHDLRRTLATGMQRLGVRFEVTEAILNHKSGSRSGIAGVYQLHEWADEKRAALDAWARHILLLTGGEHGSNVVSLSKVRA
ncbi:tyrosine-type recombinase/integrase [Qipengyuania huizhouensis]|uniref:tyrosine-type recombinase/integrase n=1 Tax=Qipengyuania huizhouensis TaxID=2867245 RepID=UPI001C88CCB4|nr:site-specific integrase [Qipengyuania huizhouensis]MBX7461769.1 site-specific integrase [Qipengyuania huizhouensis]